MTTSNITTDQALSVSVENTTVTASDMSAIFNCMRHQKFLVQESYFSTGENTQMLGGYWVADATKTKVYVPADFFLEFQTAAVEGKKIALAVPAAPAVLGVIQMEDALTDAGFFTGGLTDDQIRYHYNKYVEKGKITPPAAPTAAPAQEFPGLSADQSQNITDLANLSKLVDALIELSEKTGIPYLQLGETLADMAKRRAARAAIDVHKAF